MIEVVFKNLDTSDSLRNYLTQELQDIVSLHPRSALHKTRATIEKHRGPFQNTPDHFTVKIMSGPNGTPSMVIEKADRNLHDAIKAALGCFAMKVDKVNHKITTLRREKARSAQAQLGA